MNDYELGQHQRDIEWLKNELSLVREQMAEILEFVNNLKGRKAAIAAAFVGLSSLVGVVVSIILQVLK